jgi:hypothetical protein
VLFSDYEELTPVYLDTRTDTEGSSGTTLFVISPTLTLAPAARSVTCPE